MNIFDLLEILFRLLLT